MTRTGAAFRALPLGAVRPRGWLRAQLRRDLEHGFAARLDRLTPHAARDPFRERMLSSTDPRAWWDAETRGNWLWGYVMMAHLAGLPKHEARAARLAADLLATQDHDGYVGIYAPKARYAHPDGENGELWGQSRALLALIAQHEAAGEPRTLAAVRRAVALTLRRYGADHPCFRRGDRLERDALTGLTHGLCFLDVLEWLHETTRDPVYAEAGVRMYGEFSSMPRPFPNDDLALPNLADGACDFHGHAVHTAEHLRALFWASVVAPDRVGPGIVEGALRRLHRYVLPSGALLGDEYIHGLPLPEAGYEFCTSTELAFSLSSAVQKLGRGALGDWLEILAFNAVQGARMSDGKAIAYLSGDTRLLATAARPDDSSAGAPGRRYKFSPTHDDVACCCNPNAVRFLPQFISRMWMRLAGGDGFAAIAYGPSELRASVGDVAVTIVAETAYPLDDGIDLTVTPDRPIAFALVLREPGWAGGMEVEAPGCRVDRSDGWYRITKVWAAGDRVRVRFSWQVRIESYANGEVAVFRGPLQYVMPIDHRLEFTRSYDVEGLYDYDVVPKDPSQASRAPELDAHAAGLGLVFGSRREGDVDRPWDVARFVLRSRDTTLVPMGCTLLRKAAFAIR